MDTKKCAFGEKEIERKENRKRTFIGRQKKIEKEIHKDEREDV